MKIQTRLTLLHSTLFASIFIGIGIIIFLLYTQFIKKTIYKQLEQSSFITALFYLEEDELNKDDFAKVKLQFHESVTNSYYQVYNENNEIRYGDTNDSIAPATLNRIRNNRVLKFQTDDFFCFGIFYEDNEGDFVVIAKENKKILYNQLHILSLLLLLGFLTGTLIIVLFSRWGAHVAYRPFRKVIQQVQAFSTTHAPNYELQIESPHTEDELEELINTFNSLLTRLSESLIIQKNFAKYVTHEFKTPLASIIGNLEVFSLKERTPQEYNQVAHKLIQEVNHLNNILHTLLIISDLKDDRTEDTSAYRLDELIWSILAKIKTTHPSARVKVELDIPQEKEHLLYVRTDKTQLLMALVNLIENAIKYSPTDRLITLHLFSQHNLLHLSIKDQGIGIPPHQIKNLSKPFFRADNSNRKQGSGIGLSIALRILEKNNIQYTIHSQPQQGTTVTLWF